MHVCIHTYLHLRVACTQAIHLALPPAGADAVQASSTIGHHAASATAGVPIALDPCAMSSLSPFYFVLDSSCNVVQAGPALIRLMQMQAPKPDGKPPADGMLHQNVSAYLKVCDSAVQIAIHQAESHHAECHHACRVPPWIQRMFSASTLYAGRRSHQKACLTLQTMPHSLSRT